MICSRLYPASKRLRRFQLHSDWLVYSATVIERFSHCTKDHWLSSSSGHWKARVAVGWPKYSFWLFNIWVEIKNTTTQFHTALPSRALSFLSEILDQWSSPKTKMDENERFSKILRPDGFSSQNNVNENENKYQKCWDIRDITSKC